MCFWVLRPTQYPDANRNGTKTQELESTLRDPEVAELEVVARERAYVEACGAAVRRMSADSLARGMKSLNQTDIGGALQVRE